MADPYASNSRRQWRLVIVLLVLMMLANIDRQIISLLINPMKADLGLTDTQISLVYGAAFALAQIAFTLPAGYMADRVSRRFLIGIGAVGWSAMTMACGAAGNFWQLLLARAGVGLGEGVIQPCAYSMLRGALSPERRGRGFAVFGMAGMLGGSVALLLGGALMVAAQSAEMRDAPLLAGLRPWQTVLVLVGAIGLPVSLLMLVVHEPWRSAESEQARTGVTFREAFAYMRSRWRIYLPLFAFQILFGMLALSFGAWIAPLVGRTWGLSIPQVGVTLGLMMLVLPPMGIWIVGSLVDRGVRLRGPAGACLVGLVITAIHAVASTVTPLAPTQQAFWLMLAGLMFISGGPAPIGPTLTAMITPASMMGKVSAVQLFLNGLVAAAIGPTIVAVVSDTMFTGDRALANALSAVSAVYGALATIMLIFVLNALRREAPDAASETP